MNIWLLTSQFLPASAGGIARYVANAAEMFARAGHQVTVVTADTFDEQAELPGGARLLRFAPRDRFLQHAHAGPVDQHPAFPHNILSYWPALSYELAERVTEQIQRDGVLPDIIESQEYAALPYYLIQRRLVERHPLSSVPLVVHLHSPDFSITRANQESRFRLPGYWVGQMEKFCISAADGVISPSRFLRDEVEQDVPQVAGQVQVIPYPYTPLPALERTPTPGDLVYFGRLELRKGVPPLVQACARMWANGHDFRLTLIGGDTLFAARNMPVGQFLRTHYGQWIESGQLVIHDQPLAPPALWERLAAASMVVIPSAWDNFPNTCIEAMSLGKPVIASRAGGQAEMVGDDQQAGFVFDWNIKGSFEQAVEQALALDPQQLQAMGVQARERILAMTAFEHVLPQRESHYQEVIARSQPARTIFPSATPGITGNCLRPAPEEQAGLLSVVVPFYNLGTYVEETIASVLASTYRPLEVIILDDGSTDSASLAALERICTRHGEIVRIVRTENNGLATARNRGAEAAHGELLAFVDADDLIEPQFFERAITMLRRYTNVSFVYSWVRFFGASDTCWPTWNTELPYMLGHNMLTAFVVLRRSDFLAYGRNDPGMTSALEDYDAWISMLEQGCIGVSLPEMLVRYRLRPDSMYHSISDDQTLSLMGRIAERHRGLYERYGPELFELQNANGPSIRWNHPAAPVDEFQNHYNRLLDSWRERGRYITELEQNYRQIRGFFRFLDPLLPILRSLLRRGSPEKKEP